MPLERDRAECIQKKGKLSGNFKGIMEAIPKIFKEMPRRERFSIAPLGEYYMDLLTIDSTINARSKATQANSLLCAKLQEREQRIRARVEYLASKRGIGADELWIQILKGEFEDLKPEEIKEMEDDELE